MAKAFEVIKEEEEYYHHWRYKVHGFWSRSTVSVYMFKEIGSEEWREPTLNWSAGGRDPQEEPSDSQAVRNFASALMDAANLYDSLNEGKQGSE